MKRLRQTFHKLLAAAAIAGSVAATAPANAAVIQLGFILDESGSIGSGNYTIIKNGLAGAIGSLIPTDGSYEISVVSFDSAAQTIVNHVLIDSVAARNSVVTAIQNAVYNGGGTNFTPAFNLMSSVLQGSSQSISSTYVNFATDGATSDAAGAVTARDNLINNAGVDNLSIEAIGTGVQSAYLQNSICYPGPCDTAAPFNFPTQGFYIAVANAQGYADAIGNKIQVVIGVPEPTTVALIALGLLGLVPATRRRTSA